MTYNAVSSIDVIGLSIIMKSIALFGHVEKVDRHTIWTYDEVAEVVKEDEWITTIRAINSGLETTRRSFAHAVESIALQPDETILKTLWEQEGVAQSAVKLLLSPVDEIHDPVISLIQHSFDNVDDRGDCFHVLLARYPAAAIDGLAEALQTFIQTARITPDSCGLARPMLHRRTRSTLPVHGVF